MPKLRNGNNGVRTRALSIASPAFYQLSYRAPQKVQHDIDKLVKWSEKWQMLFNFGKCKCLHTEPGNSGMNYEMGGTILSKTVKEKDLGVTMNANMKVSEQCRIAASNGNQVLGMIGRNITYKEKKV